MINSSFPDNLNHGPSFYGGFWCPDCHNFLRISRYGRCSSKDCIRKWEKDQMNLAKKEKDQ